MRVLECTAGPLWPDGRLGFEVDRPLGATERPRSAENRGECDKWMDYPLACLECPDVSSFFIDAKLSIG